MKQRKLNLEKRSLRYSVWLDWDKPLIGLSYPARKPEPCDIPIESRPGEYYIVGTLQDEPLWMTKREADKLAILIPRAYVDSK